MIKLTFPRNLDLDGASAFLQSIGMNVVEEFLETTGAPAEWVFAFADAGGPEIHLMDERWSGIPYFVVEGSGDDAADLAEALQTRLGCVDLNGALVGCSETNDPVHQSGSVLQLGLLSPRKLDQTVFTTLARALESPARGVRISAIRACAYLGWAEFQDALRARASMDEDEDVRRSAGVVLDAYKGAARNR